MLPGVSIITDIGNTLDHVNGRYILGTNLGITIIDIETGAILESHSFPLFNAFNSITYKNTNEEFIPDPIPTTGEWSTIILTLLLFFFGILECNGVSKTKIDPINGK